MVHKKQQLWFVITLCFGQVTCFENWLETIKLIELKANSTDHTKVYFSVVKLKLGTILRVITLDSSFHNNFLFFVQSLKMRTSWKGTLNHSCNHNPHNLHYFEYKNVPRYFMEHIEEDVGGIHSWQSWQYYRTLDEQLTDLVKFEPCRHSVNRSQQDIRHLFFTKMCFPKRADFPSKDRQGFSLVLTENMLFQINLTFTVFQYTSHFWCFTDFLDIKHPTMFGTKTNTPRHVFCGTRHPWTILHTSNTVSVLTVAKSTSRFVLFYQVLDKGYLNYFHVCHYIQCQRSSGCVDNISPSFALRTTHILAHKMGFVFIVNIMVEKTSNLQLSSTAFLAVHDGPTIASAQLFAPNGKLITLSSFQATVEITSINWLKDTQNKTVSFTSQKYSLSHCLKAENSSHNFELHFNELCNITPCVQHQRYCIEQSLHFSYNISVNNVQYLGPEEPVYINKAGGIAVYFVDRCHSNQEEVLDISHNVSRHTGPTKAKPNQFTLISRASTQYVVVVYYYFSIYSFVSARIYLSRTECIGRRVLIRSCSKEHIVVHPLQGLNYCSHWVTTTIGTRKDCFVVSVDGDRRNVSVFKYFLKRRYGSTLWWLYGREEFFWVDLHIVFGGHGPTEMQLETYYFRPRITLNAQHFMLAEVHEGHLPDFLAIVSPGFSGGRDNYKNTSKCCHLSSNMSCPEIEKRKHTADVRFTPAAKVHQTAKFIAEAADNDFVFFFTGRDEIEHGWAVITVKKLTCSVLLSGRVLLPAFVVGMALQTNCKQTLGRQLKEDSDLDKFLSRNGYKTVVSGFFRPKHGGVWLDIFGRKVVFMSDALELNLPFDRGSNRVYLKSNLTKTIENGTVHFFLSHSTPVFETKWSAKVLDMYVPTLTLPKCHLHDEGDKCYFKFLISEDFLGQTSNFQVYAPETVSERGENNHLVLHQQCSSDICAGKFLSWNDANTHCKLKGMHLPSVHSTNDQRVMKHQTERHGCCQSWHNITSSGDDLLPEIEFLYETAAIYIGFQVMLLH